VAEGNCRRPGHLQRIRLEIIGFILDPIPGALVTLDARPAIASSQRQNSLRGP
jgi:hypothetical protein